MKGKAGGKRNAGVEDPYHDFGEGPPHKLAKVYSDLPYGSYKDPIDIANEIKTKKAVSITFTMSFSSTSTT